MKRRLFQVALFLFLGAIVNVAVAWAIFSAERPTVDIQFREPTSDDTRWWSSRLPESAYSPREVTELRRFGALGISIRSDDGNSPGPRAGSWSQGWPMLSLRYERWITSMGGDPIAERGMWRGWSLGEFDFVPVLPIWPGFAINTVFYAAVLWLLFAAPFALRRWRRIKRGLCPKCAYDLRGTPAGVACPECGSIVAS